MATKISAAAKRLADMRAVLTREEQLAVEAVAGMQLSLGAAAKRTGLSRSVVESRLMSGLEKLSVLMEIERAAGGLGSDVLQ